MLISPRSRSRRIAGLLLSLTAFPISACDRGGASDGPEALHPVSGRVVVGGKPAAGVEVRLHLLNRFFDAAAPHPQGTTDKDGRFQLQTGENQQGAPNGQYVATLVWPAKGGADRLGGAFAEPDGSGLTVVIDDTTTELAPIEVKAGTMRSVR